jgi:hypothetical protein
VLSVAGVLAGLTSTAIRTALGTNSCSNFSRLALISWAKKLMPVALPPGQARLATRPSLTGSSPTPKTIGDRRGRSFGRLCGIVACGRSNNGYAAADKVGHERRQAIELALQPVVIDHHVLALDVTGFAEAFTERNGIACGCIGRPTVDEAHHRHRRLLRTRRERPCRRASDQCDELAPLH